MEDKNIEKLQLIKKSFELKENKDYESAIECLYKALEIDEFSCDNLELVYQIGELHLILNNFDKALDEFQHVISMNSSHKAAMHKCFEIYYKTEQYQKALNIVQRMCEQDKNSLNYLCYFKTLKKMEKKQDILEIFNSLDDEIKMDVDILYLISEINEEKRELLLKRIVDIDETHQDANAALIKIAYKRRDFDEVVRYCINLDEKSPIASYYLGLVELNKENYQTALKYMNNAIKYGGNEYDYYFVLAKIYIELMLFDEALSSLKHSINYSLYKNSFDNIDEKYFLLGWVLFKQNSPLKAELNLKQVNSNSPLYLKAQVLIQAINCDSTNLSEVKKNLEQYYEKEKDNTILLDTLAMVYKELKMTNKAIELFVNAYKIFPNSLYYKLELIDLYIDTKQYNNAIELIDDVCKKSDKCASVYNSLARIYYRSEEYVKALECINKYIELDDNNAESHYFRGLILNDIKEYKNAKEAIYIAINLNPSVAKYYYQIARSDFELGEYESALLFSKEAVELDPNEINYKKQNYEIALKIGNEHQIQMYENQLKRSESIIKMNR